MSQISITKTVDIRMLGKLKLTQAVEELRKANNWLEETDNEDGYVLVDNENRTLSILLEVGAINKSQLEEIEFVEPDQFLLVA